MESQIWSFKLERVPVDGRTGPSDTMPSPTQNQERVNCEGRTPVPSSTGVLPRGLIGPKCTATVTIEGSHSNSLLDTGLQVTTVSKSFYESHLSHQPILPLNDLLDIEGAGGQEVPYLGYIEVSILSPENITGEPEKVNTLVLIVPNCGTNMEIPVLTGTNTLDILYEKCISHQDKHARNKTGDGAYSPLMNHLYIRHKIHQQNGRVGRV